MGTINFVKKLNIKLFLSNEESEIDLSEKKIEAQFKIKMCEYLLRNRKTNDSAGPL